MTLKKTSWNGRFGPFKKMVRGFQIPPYENDRSQLISVDGNQKSGETHQLVLRISHVKHRISYITGGLPDF